MKALKPKPNLQKLCRGCIATQLSLTVNVAVLAFISGTALKAHHDLQDFSLQLTAPVGAFNLDLP